MERRTAPELWREAVRNAPATPAYLEEGPDGLEPRVRGTRRRSGSTRSRADCSRTACGTATASRSSPGRRSTGSCSTGRSCRSAPSSSASIRRARRRSARTCSSTPRRCSPSRRTTSRRASSSPSAARCRRCARSSRSTGSTSSRPRDARRSTSSRSRSTRTTSRRSSTRPARPARRRAACSRTRTSSRRRRRSATTLEMPGDVVLLFLPMAHSYARLAHQAASHHGATIAAVADVARVPEALATVQPAVLPAVPRVYEKIHANALGEIERAGGMKRRIGLWAVSRRREGEPRRARGPAAPGRGSRSSTSSPTSSSSRRCARGSAASSALGVSGAAPLSVDVMEFFHAMGVPVIEGYGLTETASSATANEPDDFRIGTVGRPVDGCEIKLDDGRRDPHPQRLDLRRLLQGSRGDGGGAERRRLVPHAATSARSTRTASSRSPTARRI